MKFLVALILTILLAFIAGLYLPWWSIAIAAFVVALLVHQKAVKAFLSGFLGLFLLWAVLAEWIDLKNESILSARIAELLPLGGQSWLLVLVTGFVGGLVAGFAAMSASYLRSKPRRRTAL
ncbi:MAG: hypothetical protein ABW019_00940 [Chitinophagaceae bacterium]